MLFLGNGNDVIHDFKTQISSQFDMKDLVDVKYILEINIRRDRENINIWLRQNNYVNYVLQRFHMVHYRPLSILIFV